MGLSSEVLQQLLVIPYLLNFNIFSDKLSDGFLFLLFLGINENVNE